MPWCPVCKNEYKDGYKVCSDCGSDLVDELVDYSNEDNQFEIKNILEFAEDETLENMEDANALADILAGKEEVFYDRLPYTDQVKEQSERKIYKPFVKASDRAEEYKASGYALLFVGIIGIIFLFLCLCGIIPLGIADNIRVVGFTAMLIMFVIFIITGIKSFLEVKVINELGSEEDKLVEGITQLFKDNYTAESIDKIALFNEDEVLTDEMKFFKRDMVIRNIIVQNFGELDEALLMNQAESIYSSLYEN